MPKEERMPEIIVATRLSPDRNTTVLHQERVCARDLESKHFAAQLIERLGWALSDADEVERPPAGEAARRSRTNTAGEDVAQLGGQAEQRRVRGGARAEVVEAH
jgi:hypothetical protein